MPKVIEYKDNNGENRLKVESKGRITNASTEGYKNKQDMIDAAVNSSVAILAKYAPEKLAPKWISVGERLPEENETVWAFNKEYKTIALASFVYNNGWLWAVSNGTIYEENGKIVSECETDEDYLFHYWMPLPKL